MQRSDTVSQIPDSLSAPCPVEGVTIGVRKSSIAVIPESRRYMVEFQTAIKRPGILGAEPAAVQALLRISRTTAPRQISPSKLSLIHHLQDRGDHSSGNRNVEKSRSDSQKMAGVELEA